MIKDRTCGLSYMYKVGKQKVVDIMEKFVIIHCENKR